MMKIAEEKVYSFGNTKTIHLQLWEPKWHLAPLQVLGLYGHYGPGHQMKKVDHLA